MSSLPGSIFFNRFDLTDSLAGKNILITGGTGFFGKWLILLLDSIFNNGLNFKVTIVSRDPVVFLNKNPQFIGLKWLQWLCFDIKNLDKLYKLKYDLIIHAATDTSKFSHDNPFELFENITVGARNVFELAIRCGTQRILLAGSGAQYGNVPYGCNVSEDYNGAYLSNRISNVYANAKRYQETLGAVYSERYNIDVIMTRCFAFSGPYLPLDGHFAIGNFVRDALFSDKLILKSNGCSVRSYMHGSDLAIWLMVLLLKGQSGEAYNVGSDQSVSIKNLARRVASRLSSNKKVHILGQLDGVSNSYYVPDIRKSRCLGLDIWTSLDESIDSMAAWAVKEYKK